MRVLILSCNTGEGHNSCAAAVKEYFESQGDFCEIYDALKFVSDGAAKIISKGHVWVYRHVPGAFGAGYRFAEKHPEMMDEDSGTYRFFAKGARPLFEYVENGRFEAVICTHVFSALMLTEAIKRYPVKAVTAFLATDYTCSPGVKDSGLDMYFIPDERLREDFVSPGIPDSKITVCGIPVRKMFYESIPASKARERFGIPSHSKHLLVMCGSMGCGPLSEIIELLAQRLDGNHHVTVVCGTNNRLKEQLEELCAYASNIHIKGYVEDMSALMDSADLYLTKPGGLSVTEAAVKGLPMVFINAVAGCEEYNHRFFAEMDSAVGAETPEELAYLCALIMKNDMQRNEMKKRISESGQKYAAQVIYDTVCAMAGTKKHETA